MNTWTFRVLSGSSQQVVMTGGGGGGERGNTTAGEGRGQGQRAEKGIEHEC